MPEKLCGPRYFARHEQRSDEAAANNLMTNLYGRNDV